MADLRIWIDATRPSCRLRVFGMTLVERILRAALQAGLRPSEAWVDLPADAPAPRLPADLIERVPVRFRVADGTAGERLAEVFDARPEATLLALEGDSIVDPRVLAALAAAEGSLAARGGEGEACAAVLRLEKPPSVSTPPGGLDAIAGAWLAAGAVQELRLDAIPDYLDKLRRRLPAYLFRISSRETRDEAERFLFWSNYKGSTDFFTKYVYPPLVWRMVRPLAHWRVHPNWLTAFNVVITCAAVPLFASGWWISGFLCAYGMSVLDSVDGKLARLTYRSSQVGHVLDHGLDLVHPPFWYAAWAWALGGGAGSLLFQASIGLTAAYFLDRIVVRLFTWRAGRSIHSYTPLDVRLRTWISRRNINLPLFTVGLLAGVPGPAFWTIVAWQVATLAYHAQRLVQYWNALAYDERRSARARRRSALVP